MAQRLLLQLDAPPVLGRNKFNKPNLELWDQYFSSALAVEKSLSEDVLERVHSGLLDWDDEVGTQEIVMQKMERVSEHNKKILVRLWQLYDSNGDKELDEDEVRPVILDSLTSLSKWMPIYFREIASVNMRVIRYNYSAKQIRELRELMKAFMEASEVVVDRFIQTKLRDLNSVIRRVWQALDGDNSGIIRQQEFVDQYAHAITEVIDPEELKRILEELWLGDQSTNNESQSEYELTAAMILRDENDGQGGISLAKVEKRGVAKLSWWKRKALDKAPWLSRIIPGARQAIAEDEEDLEFGPPTNHSGSNSRSSRGSRNSSRGSSRNVSRHGSFRSLNESHSHSSTRRPRHRRRDSRGSVSSHSPRNRKHQSPSHRRRNSKNFDRQSSAERRRRRCHHRRNSSGGSGSHSSRASQSSPQKS